MRLKKILWMEERDSRKISLLAKLEAKKITKLFSVACLVEIGQIKHQGSSWMTKIQIPLQKCYSQTYKNKPNLMARFISLTREEKMMPKKSWLKLKQKLTGARPTSISSNRSSSSRSRFPLVIVKNLKRLTLPQMEVKIVPYSTRSPSHQEIRKK